METRIVRTVVALGVPGLSLGVFYLLLRQFGFQFSTIGPAISGLIAVLFLAIVGGTTVFALHRWAPPKRSEARVEIERYRGAITAKFLALNRELNSILSRLGDSVESAFPGQDGVSPEKRMLQHVQAEVQKIEQAFNKYLDKGDIYRAHEELNGLRLLATEHEALRDKHAELHRKFSTMHPGSCFLHGSLMRLAEVLASALHRIASSVVESPEKALAVHDSAG